MPQKAEHNADQRANLMGIRPSSSLGFTCSEA